MRWTLQGNNRGHRGPVSRARRARIERLVKSAVRSMAGKVVVIAGMVVAGAATVVAQRTNDCHMMSLLGEMRQVFAELNPGRGCCRGLEDAPVLFRSVRLHVPRIDVGCSTAQKDHDRGFRNLSTGGFWWTCCQLTGQIKTEIAHPSRNEKRSTSIRVSWCHWSGWK